MENFPFSTFSISCLSLQIEIKPNYLMKLSGKAKVSEAQEVSFSFHFKQAHRNAQKICLKKKQPKKPKQH